MTNIRDAGPCPKNKEDSNYIYGVVAQAWVTPRSKRVFHAVVYPPQRGVPVWTCEVGGWERRWTARFRAVRPRPAK